MRKMFAAVLAGVLLLQPGAVCADLPDLGEVADTKLSLADEYRIGRDAIRALRQEGVVIDDADVSSYLTAIGALIAASARVPNLRFTFFALNDYSINAFALPGGYIGVNAGLILASQSEGELASVLGHEIAHVTQRHLARMQAANAPNQLWLLASIVAAALAAGAGSGGNAAFGALHAGFGLSIANQLAFSRDFEREADRVGMQYLAQAGFDVRNMPDFFVRMQQINRYDNNNAFAFLRTHPVTGERISEAQNRAESYPVRIRANSTAYLLTREKLRVASMEAPEAVKYYQNALERRLFLSEGAAWYGMACARLAMHDGNGASAALEKARRRLPADPMLLSLSADIARDAKDWAAARAIYRRGLAAFPNHRSLSQGEIALLLDSGERIAALARLRSQLELYPNNAALYRLEARAYVDHDPLKYHVALGNALYFEQRYEAALEQYHLASEIKNVRDDFFLHSAVEARTRELERLLKDEKHGVEK